MKNILKSFCLSRPASACRWSSLPLACAVLAAWPIAAKAQTELIIGETIGMDNQFVYPHTNLPGATGINFSFTGAFAPMYPPEETHTVVIVFEWGPTSTGPWSTSPDNVNTVPGGTTDFFATGLVRGPDTALWVATRFYAGGPMTVSGEFTHLSVIPEPGTIGLAGVGLVTLLPITCRRHRTRLV